MSEKTNNINTKLRQLTDSESQEVIGGLTTSTPYVSRILTDDDYKEELALSLNSLPYNSKKIKDEDFDDDGMAEFKIEI